MSDESAKVPAPPYVPYKTFINFLNGLGESGIPAQIDKSIMRSLSGSIQSMLYSSLEYLKLIDKAGNPSPQLTQLVESNDKQRGEILRSVLEKAYPFLFSGTVDLKRATTKQVEQAFRDQGVGGSTVVKCIAFFLAAAKDAAIQVSSHVKTPQVQRTAGAKRNGGQNPPAAQEAGMDDQPPPQRDSRQLRLPVPGKGEVLLAFPKDFGKADWDFIKPIFEAYLAKMFAA